MPNYAAKVALGILKATVTVVLLVYATRGVDWIKLSHDLSRITWGAITVAVILITAQNLLAALRWWYVVAGLGTRLPALVTLQFFYLSLFVGQTLPSGIGGDAARMLLLYRQTVSLSRSFNSIVLDRVLTAVGLVLLIAIGMPTLLDMGASNEALGGIVLLSAVVIVGAVALPVIPYFGRVPWIGRFARPFEQVRAYLSSARNVLVPIALSCVGFALMAALVYVLANAMGTQLELHAAIALGPPVFLVATLPISIAGWGVRETAMVVALSLAHVDPSSAVAISVALGITVLVGSLPGALLLATFRHRVPAGSVP